jgi:hypothetical protein
VTAVKRLLQIESLILRRTPPAAVLAAVQLTPQQYPRLAGFTTAQKDEFTG